MNKKLDRFKQWAGERMGGEAKTSTSDEFKSLELEMDLRRDGMDKLHSSMATYIKTMSMRKEADDKEKMLPVDVLAHAMISHGEEFESDSLFGTCLMMMGQANEKVARVQDSYVQAANESWLESLERSLAQMKEYQAARRKLESRRLAYDATLSKMQKQKKEDFRMEEELRAQRIKYEESSDDVYRRMGEIQDSEAESMSDLGAFLDAEFEYYDRCRDILYNLRRQWPAGQQKNRNRSRSLTAHSFGTNGTREESPAPPEPDRPHIGSRVKTSDRGVPSNGQFRLPELESDGMLKPTFPRANTSRLYELESDGMPKPTFQRPNTSRLSETESDGMLKPIYQRTNTSPALPFEGPTTSERMQRAGSEGVIVPPPLPRHRQIATDAYASENEYSSPPRDRHRYADQHDSPAHSVASASRSVSRASSNNTLGNNTAGARKQPPPPPPAARKKPPPPPPKRTTTGLS